MKTTLTIQESAELIKRGVSADKASMVCMDFNGTYAYICGEETQTVRDCVNGQFYVEESRVFTLADLLSLLPKKLDGTYRLKIQSCDWPAWTVCYTDFQSGAKGRHQSMELIDALYKLLLWSIDNSHVKLD